MERWSLRTNPKHADTIAGSQSKIDRLLPLYGIIVFAIFADHRQSYIAVPSLLLTTNTCQLKTMKCTMLPVLLPILLRLQLLDMTSGLTCDICPNCWYPNNQGLVNHRRSREHIERAACLLVENSRPLTPPSQPAELDLVSRLQHQQPARQSDLAAVGQYSFSDMSLGRHPLQIQDAASSTHGTPPPAPPPHSLQSPSRFDYRSASIMPPRPPTPGGGPGPTDQHNWNRTQQILIAQIAAQYAYQLPLEQQAPYWQSFQQQLQSFQTGSPSPQLSAAASSRFPRLLHRPCSVFSSINLNRNPDSSHWSSSRPDSRTSSGSRSVGSK